MTISNNIKIYNFNNSVCSIYYGFTKTFFFCFITSPRASYPFCIQLLTIRIGVLELILSIYFFPQSIINSYFRQLVIINNIK